MSSPSPTCHEISEALALRHAGLLENTYFPELDDHLSHCAHCQTKAEQFSQLAHSLQQLGQAIALPNAAQPHEPAVTLVPVRSVRRSVAAIAAIAAMLLMMVGLILKSADRPPERPAPSTVIAPSVAPQPVIARSDPPPPVLFEYQRYLARGLDLEELLDAQSAVAHREATIAISFNDSY